MNNQADIIPMNYKIRENEEEKLSLFNDGQLSLFFVGTGSAFTKKLYQTNLLIIKGDEHILIDCGTKTPQAFHELGVPVSKIKKYLITHSHADHIGGLEEVMLSGKYITKTKPEMIITKTYKHLLWDLSLRGGCGFNQDDFGYPLVFEDFFEVKYPERINDYSRDAYHYNTGKIDIRMFRTMHIPEEDTWDSGFWSCGVIIDDKVLYSGDTRFDPGFLYELDKKHNFKAIFHDCQFFTGGVHSGIDELKTLKPEIKNKMFLMHYGDNFEDYKDKIKDCGFLDFARQWVYYDF